LSSPLRQYAYAQARIRARLPLLPGHARLEELASLRDAATLERELAEAGWSDPAARVQAGFTRVLRILDGEPRALVARYRDRYVCENLKVLLRARERGLRDDAVASLLHPIGVLVPGRGAEELLSAPSLAEAFEHFEPEPLGRVLRRHVRTASAGGLRLRLELVAERTVYEALWQQIEPLSRPDRVSARRILGVKLDAVNLVRAARLRLEHGLPPEEILGYAIRGGSFAARERSVLAHEPPDAWAGLLSHTPWAPALAQGVASDTLAREVSRRLEQEARRSLRSSPFCIGFFLGYLLLLELLAQDVRRLVAGRRFSRPPEWVRAGLVTRRR
jgi:vacuolar-type H+-ATPase subunit C/Vma6